MENQELLSKVITIESVEPTTTATGKVRIKIKAGGLTYAIWKLKADGTESKAYEGLKAFGLDAVGQTVEIAYKEDKGEFQGKEIVYRTIVMLKPSDGTPVSNIVNDSKTNQMQNAILKNANDIRVIMTKLGLTAPSNEQNEPSRWSTTGTPEPILATNGDGLEEFIPERQEEEEIKTEDIPF